MRGFRPVLLLALLPPTVLAFPARAHEVEAEIVRGRTVAVRAIVHGGSHLAGAQAEVYAPADPGRPWWTGQTDRDGWVTFAPDAPGRWRVRIIDARGHGLDTQVEVAAPGAAPAAAGDAPRPTTEIASTGVAYGPVVGIAAIAVVFALLLLRERRRKP